MAEKIRGSVAATPARFEEKSIGVTVSVGVAEAGPSPRSPESFLAEADEALYLSKKSGRNCINLRQPARAIGRGVMSGPDTTRDA